MTSERVKNRCVRRTPWTQLFWGLEPRGPSSARAPLGPTFREVEPTFAADPYVGPWRRRCGKKVGRAPREQNRRIPEIRVRCESWLHLAERWAQRRSRRGRPTSFEAPEKLGLGGPPDTTNFHTLGRKTTMLAPSRSNGESFRVGPLRVRRGSFLNCLYIGPSIVVLRPSV